MIDDAELLRRFTVEHSEAAFRELVRNRIDFVYAAALRQVGGDAHLAQEVAQSVFLDLVRKARVLAHRASIAGWLYTSTRFAAAKALRTRARRMNREQEAHTMQEILSANSAAETDWNELRPVLDAAMHELSDADREAILLRYFQGRSLAEVGANLGLVENSARMRVDRALEKLRVRLARRGITSTAVALGVALAAQPAVAAPTGMAALVAGSSLAAAASGTGGLAAAWTTFKFMNLTKLTITAGAVAALGLGAFLGMYYQAGITGTAKTTSPIEQTAAISGLRDENRRLTDALARLQAERTTTVAALEAAGGAKSQAASSLEDLRVLASLQEKKWVQARMTFVDPDGKLNRVFTDLFALAPPEQTALQQTVDRAREQLQELERANATVTRNEKGEVIVALKPFAKEGGQVYDEMLNSFARVLGPERNAAYLTLGAEQVEGALAGFGAVERTVTFGYDPNEAGTPYSLRDDRNSPSNHSVNNSKFKNIDEMAKRAGTVMRFLPPNFGAKK